LPGPFAAGATEGGGAAGFACSAGFGGAGFGAAAFGTVGLGFGVEGFGAAGVGAAVDGGGGRMLVGGACATAADSGRNAAQTASP